MTRRPSTSRTCFGSNGSISPCASAMRRIHLSLLIVMRGSPWRYSRCVAPGRRALLSLALSVLALAGAHAQEPASTRVDASGDAVIFQGRIDRPAVERFLDALRDP